MRDGLVGEHGNSETKYLLSLASPPKEEREP
jgi:hypothetical protein